MVSDESVLVLALRDARVALNSAPDGHLELRHRKRVLFALGEPRYEPPGSGRGVVTVGLRRRVDLYARCTRKVLPIWNDVVGSRDPELMLELAESYLAGATSREVVWKMQNTFGAYLLNAPTALPKNQFYVSYVGDASIGTVLTALGDIYFSPGEEEFTDYDLDVFENSLYAMAAYSGELPWGEESDPNLRREFWHWWLDEAVPAAARSYEGPGRVRK